MTGQCPFGLLYSVLMINDALLKQALVRDVCGQPEAGQLC